MAERNVLVAQTEGVCQLGKAHNPYRSNKNVQLHIFVCCNTGVVDAVSDGLQSCNRHTRWIQGARKNVQLHI